jgi:hypothetical protein
MKYIYKKYLTYFRRHNYVTASKTCSKIRLTQSYYVFSSIFFIIFKQHRTSVHSLQLQFLEIYLKLMERIQC